MHENILTNENPVTLLHTPETLTANVPTTEFQHSDLLPVVNFDGIGLESIEPEPLPAPESVYEALQRQINDVRGGYATADTLDNVTNVLRLSIAAQLLPDTATKPTDVKSTQLSKDEIENCVLDVFELLSETDRAKARHLYKELSPYNDDKNKLLKTYERVFRRLRIQQDGQRIGMLALSRVIHPDRSAAVVIDDNLQQRSYDKARRHMPSDSRPVSPVLVDRARIVGQSVIKTRKSHHERLNHNISKQVTAEDLRLMTKSAKQQLASDVLDFCNEPYDGYSNPIDRPNISLGDVTKLIFDTNDEKGLSKLFNLLQSAEFSENCRKSPNNFGLKIDWDRFHKGIAIKYYGITRDYLSDGNNAALLTIEKAQRTPNGQALINKVNEPYVKLAIAAIASLSIEEGLTPDYILQKAEQQVDIQQNSAIAQRCIDALFATSEKEKLAAMLETALKECEQLNLGSLISSLARGDK